MKTWDLRLADFVSRLLHPLWMPFYAMLLLWFVEPMVNIAIPANYLPRLSLLVFLYTALLPLIFALVLRKLGLIKSLEMETAKERRFPYLFTAVCYFLCYFQMAGNHALGLYALVLLGATVSILALLLVNLRVKVSAHLVGVGGTAGVFAGLQWSLGLNYGILVAALVLVAGLLASARLRLQAHSEAEVYVGFILGFCTEFLLLMQL
jgi:hypothetical protein